jgi:hypothetical protein
VGEFGTTVSQPNGDVWLVPAGSHPPLESFDLILESLGPQLGRTVSVRVHAFDATGTV